MPDFFEVGDSFTFDIQVEPEDATNKEYKIFSHDNSIASIGRAGRIQAQKDGTTEITVSSVSNPEIKQTFSITENKTPCNKIAYIKFKSNKTNKYVSKAENRKWSDIVLKVTQEKNPDPPGVTLRWVHGINPPSEAERERIRYNGGQPAVPYAFLWHETAHTNFFNARKASYVQPAGTVHVPDSNAC